MICLADQGGQHEPKSLRMDKFLLPFYSHWSIIVLVGQTLELWMDWLKKVWCTLSGHSEVTVICLEEPYKIICQRCGRKI